MHCFEKPWDKNCCGTNNDKGRILSLCRHRSRLITGILDRFFGKKASFKYEQSHLKASQLLVATLGIVQLARGHASGSFREPIFEDTSHSPSAYALALYSGLWAFDGWDQANYVGGEMRSPEKNVPRAIHCSMATVVVSLLSSQPRYRKYTDWLC